MPEPCTRIFTCQGVPILEIDFSHCSINDVLERIAIAQQQIAKHPPYSLRTLTLVEGTRFNGEVNAALQAYTAANKPYVRRAAVVGASDLRKIVLHGIRIVTGRDIRPFDRREAAIDWLVSSGE